LRREKRWGDFRTILAVPMLRESAPNWWPLPLPELNQDVNDESRFETCNDASRKKAGDRIENVRLFEPRAGTKTKELSQSLDERGVESPRRIADPGPKKLASWARLHRRHRP